MVVGIDVFHDKSKPGPAGSIAGVVSTVNQVTNRTKSTALQNI